MEEEYYADRLKLRHLLRADPSRSSQALAAETGRCVSWVRKWVKRLRAAGDEDQAVLRGLSRIARHSKKRVSESVIERVLEIRDAPPEPFPRVPGSIPILYYLHQDEDLKAQGVYLPSSTRTIWQILKANGRLSQAAPAEKQRMERPAPLSEWQIDFKDASTVPADPDGKQQHVVEVLNVIDKGTSILLDALPREDYTAETAILAITNTFLHTGLPEQMTFDRDPRFVGNNLGDHEFPSAFKRYLLCLGIRLDVCPPRRPDRNAFVERFNRSYKYECLLIHFPKNLGEVHEVTETYKTFYNQERPSQAITCQNLPPYQAFPQLPVRPSLPDEVDPDHWLRYVDGMTYKRSVSSNGRIQIGRYAYHIGRIWAGHRVVLEVAAASQKFLVHHRREVIKEMSIKGLHHVVLEFEDYLRLICEEANREAKLLSAKQRNMHHSLL